MTGKVSPSNADNQAVSWTSSNTAIATIDATTGLAKGIAVGTATITGKTADGGFVDTETINVIAA